MHENADLIYDILELIFWQAVEVAAEVAIYGFQESSIGVLLEHLCPFEEQLEGLSVLLSVDFLTVDDIDLCDQRFVLLHIVLEGFSQVLALFFILWQVCLVFQDEAGVADLFF